MVFKLRDLSELNDDALAMEEGGKRDEDNETKVENREKKSRSD